MTRKFPYRVSPRRMAVERLVPFVDLLLSPLVLLATPVMLLVARLGWRGRLSRRILDSAGIAVLRHHYYSPVVFQSDLSADLDAPRELPGIDMREEHQVALLSDLSFSAECETALAGFDFDNPNFARIDSYVLYSMLRHLQPRRMYEIGSGFSTRVASAALSRNATACSHLCIEPYEMPWLEQTGATIVRKRLEDLPLALFDELEAGDVLFIDSSHTVRPQGDVVREYLQILPRLAPGVVIHVHDVYTPHDVHPYLVVEQRKIWTEQYVMEALLSGGGRFEVMLANYWIGRQHPKAFANVVPGFALPPERDGCSFWMRRAG